MSLERMMTCTRLPEKRRDAEWEEQRDLTPEPDTPRVTRGASACET